MITPGRVVRGIRRAFYANPGRELSSETNTGGSSKRAQQPTISVARRAAASRSVLFIAHQELKPV
jgi:hypothetical protein